MATRLGLGCSLQYGGGRAAALSGAQTLLATLGDTYGLAIDFATDQSITISDAGTPANNTTSAGTVTSGALVGPGGKLTYTSPSPKLCLQSNGYYAYQAHNLLTYSDDISNAVWSKNQITASGTDTILETAANNYHYSQSNSVAVLQFYYYGEFKASGRSQFAIYFGAAGHVGVDLSTGTLGAVSGGAGYGTYRGATFTIAALANGWYSVSGYANAAIASATAFYLFQSWAPGGVPVDTYTGDVTKGIQIRKVQLSNYPCVTDYVATTSAAVYSLPYEWNTSGVCQGVKIEEARTNLALYSNTFSNAVWTLNNITNVSTTTTGPDGVSGSAVLLSETVTNAAHRVYQAINKASSSLQYTQSVYAKAGVVRTRLKIECVATGTAECIYDLAGGQIGVAATASSNFSGASGTITSVGNGWYKCTLTYTNVTNTTLFTTFGDDAGTGTGAASGGYAGTVGNGVYIWNAQLEQASTASSPILTTSATVTRAADNLKIATSLFPYSSTADTIYGQATPRGGLNWAGVAGMASGGGARRHEIRRTNGGAYGSVLNDGSTGISGGAWATDATSKLALAGAASDWSFYVNGASIGTNASVSHSVGSAELVIGQNGSYSDVFNGHIRSILYIPRRATNAELQTLTS